MTGRQDLMTGSDEVWATAGAWQRGARVRAADRCADLHRDREAARRQLWDAFARGRMDEDSFVRRLGYLDPL